MNSKKQLLLKAAGIALLVAAASVFSGCNNGKSDTIVLGYAMRTLTNPYYVQAVEGVRMFVESYPEGTFDLNVMASEGDDKKQIDDIRALIAKGGKNTIIVIDPNQAPNAATVAEICEEVGVYWSTIWSTAEGLTPSDYEYYVFHETGNDVQFGYDIAEALFESFETPGEGKVLAIQGMLANSAAINRFQGLQNALADYPGIELLDDQAGDWSPTKAQSITETWLAAYDDIDGIWVANDSMATAVVESLRARGLVGQVGVVGIDATPDALAAVEAGDMIATVSPLPWAQAGYGASICYMAFRGELDKAGLPPGNMVYTAGLLVTTDTIGDYMANYIDSPPQFDFEDPSDFIVKGIE